MPLDKFFITLDNDHNNIENKEKLYINNQNHYIKVWIILNYFRK